MNTFFEDDISRIYVTDASDNEHWGDTIFETKVLGDTRSYRLLCNPYEPITKLENVNAPSDRVNLHGMMLPSENAEKETWAGVVEVLISEIRKNTKELVSFSADELIEIHKINPELYQENNISEHDRVFVSKAPVELNGVRFRLTLYYYDEYANGHERLVKATLVAIERQESHTYQSLNTAEIHAKWLRSYQTLGTDTSIVQNELYGIKEIRLSGRKYYRISQIISCEHDPKSGSDIIVSSFYQDDSQIPWKERNKLYSQVNEYAWKDVSVKEVIPIGFWWQGGLFTGMVDNMTRYFIYHGTPSGNENFFNIAEASQDDFEQIKEEYKDYLDSQKVLPDNIWSSIKQHVGRCQYVYGGWNIL